MSISPLSWISATLQSYPPPVLLKICAFWRRTIKVTGTGAEKVPGSTPGTYGRNEMDSHADTSCAGRNWALLETTNQRCEVAPFLESYGTIKNVQIGRCATVWTDSFGDDFLLVANQMLWFGDGMENSLLNPNQL